ncbi:MAG: GNAT family N-acetyltransferase [Nocardioides sp.]
MSRSPVVLRCADPADAPRLRELWADVLRRADAEEQAADLVRTIERVAKDPDERLVVAEVDGEICGAVLLKATELSPINSEPLVQIVSPHVFPEFRHRGAGRALMEAAATFAEERGIHLVGAASLSGSRDANRFMARLGLAPQAVLRVAATHQLRARLTPSVSRQGRQLGQLLAARRSMRRSQSVAASES